MSLVPVKSLREETLPIFYDMINFEVAMSKTSSFPIVEHAVISSLDKYFSDGLGDQQYVELLVNILSSWFQRNQKLQATGLDFVRKVNIFMNLLLELRANVSKDEIDAMIVIEKLLKFYRNELNRDDLYIDYLYKLYKIHKATNNFAEAAFVLLEHADRLSWEPRSLSVNNYCSSVVLKYQNCHTERDLKEELYEEIIDLLDKGKMWEEAIRCSKEIEREYEENQLDYVALSDRLEMRSRLSRKIVDKSVVRIPSPYFFVGYFGHGWPEQYSNRMFIYRGNEFELRDDLIDTIQLEGFSFPQIRA
jgi:tetratricopeptide (TPR) repeat protein